MPTSSRPRRAEPARAASAALLARYRRSGADPPFGDPRAYHGVAMEGYFWRVTDAAQGTAVVVFLAINRPPEGTLWATVGIAAHPGGFARSVAAPRAAITGAGSIAVRALDGERIVLDAGEHSVAVDLGPDARVALELREAREWPRRPFGGIGPAQVLPRLSQHWHPWLLRARADVDATLGDRVLRLRGARAYAEKSWGAPGFPRRWWWGQAHDFPAGDVCVAFAGGDARALGLPVGATSVVVCAGRDVVRITRPPAALRVHAEDGTWRIAARSARHAVAVEGDAGGNAAHLLPVPVIAERRNAEQVAAQHLAGEMRVDLRRGRRRVYAGLSPLAGLERGGSA